MTEHSAEESYSRQYIMTCICGGKKYVRVNVPVGHPLFGKAVPCVCQRDEEEAERAARLQRLSGISHAQRDAWRFDTFDPALSSPRNDETRKAMAGILEDCRRYARTRNGWLVLSGRVGSGKTHLAYAIGVEALNAKVPTYANTVGELLNTLRAGYSDGSYQVLFDLVQGAELLVLDDLGAERETDWAAEVLYMIINHRYANRLPLVVTTNFNPLQPGGNADERIISRLTEGARTGHGWSRVLTLPCGDYRARAERRAA